MLKEMFNSGREYVREGMMFSAGFEPVSVRPGGAVRYQGYNTLLTRQANEHIPQLTRQLFTSNTMKKWGLIAGSGSALGFSAYNVISGFNENGLAGAKDAAVWELATTSAAARFAYGSVGTSGPVSAQANSLARMMGKHIGIKNAGSRIVFGGGGGALMGMGRVAGAGIGATVGQAALGTPGAFLGAFVGAAPLRFAATHPLIAGGMVAGAAAAAVGYGTYSATGTLLRAGYQHRQRQRGIDTSGSMAAFMTQGAQTMRQRAVSAIHKSHMNARSALGQEAGFMHMPGKNYHSRYR